MPHLFLHVQASMLHKMGLAHESRMILVGLSFDFFDKRNTWSPVVTLKAYAIKP